MPKEAANVIGSLFCCTYTIFPAFKFFFLHG